MKQIGEILKAARATKGMTATDLAEAVGIPLEQILSAESGTSIQADVLYSLVNYLNIPPDEVLSYIEARNWSCATDADVEDLFKV